jgi:hypothetical protein
MYPLGPDSLYQAKYGKRMGPACSIHAKKAFGGAYTYASMSWHSLQWDDAYIIMSQYIIATKKIYYILAGQHDYTLSCLPRMYMVRIT